MKKMTVSSFLAIIILASVQLAEAQLTKKVFRLVCSPAAVLLQCRPILRHFAKDCGS